MLGKLRRIRAQLESLCRCHDLEYFRNVSATSIVDEARIVAARHGYVDESNGLLTPVEALAAVGRMIQHFESGRYLTPNQLARELKVSPDKVRAMIKSNRLKARDVSGPGKRARYLIDREDLKALDVEAPPARRKRRGTDGITEYF
ncbi:MAG: helix-turn-helix domain-containing protein [Pirellulales bacterium]